jgi:hypothetical protein
MADKQCPLCGSIRFYVRDPEDEFETIEFDIENGCPHFDPDRKDDENPEIDEESPIYCDRCTWHGPLGNLK